MYPSVRFTYRPMLPQDRLVVARHMADSNDPRKEETDAAATIKAQVIDWNVRDREGKTVPLEVSHVLRLQPLLLERLFRIVMGEEAPDEDPQTSDQERNMASELDYQAALARQTPEEYAEKNLRLASASS